MARSGAESVTIRYAEGAPPSSLRCLIEVGDPALLGHAAELRIVRHVKVKDQSPVHATDVVFKSAIASLAAANEVDIPREGLKAFSYRGTQIDIEVHSELQIHDGYVVDTQVRQQEEMSLGLKPAVSDSAKEIVDPADAFDFVTNLKAIPPKNRVIAVALAAVGSVVILFNTWLGAHDESAQTAYFYSRGSDESPMKKSLVGSGALGAALWLALRKQFQKYMTFEMAAVPPRIGLQDEIEASRLVRGQPRVDLHDVVVRVVACNFEKGQYRRRSGTKTRTVSFSEPVRAVILYDKRVKLIPAGSAVEDHLDGVVRFEPMFRALYPPLLVGETHGLSVHWEVQLINDQLVDQELVCGSECFEYQDFMAS